MLEIGDERTNWSLQSDRAALTDLKLRFVSVSRFSKKHIKQYFTCAPYTSTLAAQEMTTHREGQCSEIKFTVHIRETLRTNKRYNTLPLCFGSQLLQITALIFGMSRTVHNAIMQYTSSTVWVLDSAPAQTSEQKETLHKSRVRLSQNGEAVSADVEFCRWFVSQQFR